MPTPRTDSQTSRCQCHGSRGRTAPGTSPLRERLDTLERRVAALAEKYGPEVLQNYTLTWMLYMHDYEGIRFNRAPLDGYEPQDPPAVARGWLPDSVVLRMAKAGRFANMTSVHRAITAVKRDFQTPEQRRRALEREAGYREAFRVEAEGWP